jgi:transcriptional regulator with XRE-family HTH domain
MRANMSQAAFARSLNLSVGYISQLERGAKQPKGPARQRTYAHFGMKKFGPGKANPCPSK